MIPQVVIDQETGARYEIERTDGKPILLGSGAIAAVYRAKLLSKNKEHPEIAPYVAVKVAFPNLLTSTLEDFRAEQERIAKLRQHTHCVPWAHQGKDQQHPELDLFLLELMDPEWRLPNLVARQYSGHLPEGLALEIGQQYAQLLVVLHEQAKLTMRGDRKEGDLYWDGKRLIVLDWNRAQPLPSDERIRAALIRQDIRIFGHLLAQSMLGRAVQRLEPDDDADKDWMRLSLGTRLIFAQAFGCSIGEYESARTLEKDLNEHLQRFHQAETSPVPLLRDAQRLKNEAETILTPTERIERARAVHILADLVIRAQSSTSRQKEQASELEGWARKFIETERSKIKAITHNLREELELGQYQRAARSAEEAMARFAGAGHAEWLARLTLRRWQIVAQLAQAGVSNNIKMRDLIKNLVSVLDRLDNEVAPLSLSTTSDALGTLLYTVQQMKQQLDVEIPTMIKEVAQPLLFELAIRVNWINGTLAELERRDEDARQSYAQALENWKNLAGIEWNYAQGLQKTLPPLARYIDEDTKRQVPAFASDAQALIDQAQTVFDALQQATEWPNVHKPVEEALQFYREKLASILDLKPSDENLEALRQKVIGNVTLLRVIRYLEGEMQVDVQERNEDLALERVHTQVQAEHSEVKDALIRLLTMSALEHIKHITDTGRWPDELEHGKRLLKAVTDYGSKYADQSLALEIQSQAAQRFKEWEQQLQHQYSINDFLTKLDDQRLDDALRIAEEKRIELFRRDGLSADEAQRRSVVMLRQARETAKLNQAIGVLVDEIRKLENQLGVHRDTLEKQFEETNQALTQAQTILKQYQNQTANQVKALEAQTPKIEEVARNFDQIARRIDELYKEHLPRSEETVKHLQQRLSAWQNVAQEVETAVQRVKEAAQRLTEPQGITQVREDARHAIPRLRQILQATYVAAGIEMMYRLDIEKANYYLQLAKNAAPLGQLDVQPTAEQVATSQEQTNEVVLLEEALDWLNNHTQEREQLSKWSKALNETNVQEAEEARAGLYQALSNPPPLIAALTRKLDERHHWLVKNSLTQLVDQLRTAFGTPNFGAEVSRLFLSSRDIDDLEKRLTNLIQERMQQQPPTILDWEILSSWSRRLSEVSWVKKQLQEADAKIREGAVVVAQNYLAELYHQSSDEVFYVFFEEWQEKLKKIPNTQSLLNEGKQKQERGEQLLRMLSGKQLGASPEL